MRWRSTASSSDAERGTLQDAADAKFRALRATTSTRSSNDAIAAENEAVDLYRFTSVLKRQMSEDERIRVIENLWEIVFADGASHEFEENLVWRVAELLGVSRARPHCQEARGSGK